MKSFFSTSTPVIANQKHIGSIGFINSLNSETLPLLPNVHALFLWDTVLHNIPQCPENASEKQKEDWPIKELEELKDYMGTNWIQRKDRMWEFFGLGRTKNTNVCETFHAYLTRRYLSKPNLTEFLSKLQLEFTRFDDRIVLSDFIRVKGDGHCGFRALSALITGNERYH
uniref:OTU domain-containing protein n=1 Tax=Panagrolaimus davidi TaxID=227884 RepID=A0A914QXV3_9BILA